MHLEVILPAELPEDRLREALDAVGARQEVEITVTPVDAEVL